MPNPAFVSMRHERDILRQIIRRAANRLCAACKGRGVYGAHLCLCVTMGDDSERFAA